VIRRTNRKDAIMARKSALLLLAVAIAGCSHQPGPVPEAGMAAVNVPLVNRADYAFDAAAPDGSLSMGEAARLDAWFRSLDLRYGYTIYVDGGYSGAATGQVADMAGQYCLLVTPGAPVTAGAVGPRMVRVVVSRTVALVANCPNWNVPAQPNYNTRMMPNFRCAVHANLAAMVANPEDLINGRAGSGVGDAATAARAIGVYRTTPPTGTKGLQDVNTQQKGNQ
jgi:pilus assembly protein CpaD